MKVVYVTGCLGFIGSYVTRACLDKGWYVKGVDKITYAANGNLLAEFYKYDNFSFVKFSFNNSISISIRYSFFNIHCSYKICTQSLKPF